MPMHQARFPGESLFDRVARAVCRAGVLPRKELYESWETARRTRRRFRGGRVLDLACGHGLVAHLMLLLDNRSEQALAVDTRIPDSARALSAALVQSWPRLENRVVYHSKSLSSVAAGPGDILVSAHACGPLTDQVLEKAVAARARVAVLPCCHDMDQCPTEGLEAWMDSDLAIDAVRVIRLRMAGYRVWAGKIPGQITPKNRLILGQPVAGKVLPGDFFPEPAFP